MAESQRLLGQLASAFRATSQASRARACAAVSARKASNSATTVAAPATLLHHSVVLPIRTAAAIDIALAAAAPGDQQLALALLEMLILGTSVHAWGCSFPWHMSQLSCKL